MPRKRKDRINNSENTSQDDKNRTWRSGKKRNRTFEVEKRSCADSCTTNLPKCKRREPSAANEASKTRKRGRKRREVRRAKTVLSHKSKPVVGPRERRGSVSTPWAPPSAPSLPVTTPRKLRLKFGARLDTVTACYKTR